jgi:hypothetical protein
VLIVETALHSFLLSVPQAAAVWLIMLAVAFVAVAALSVPDRQNPTDDRKPRRDRSTEPGSDDRDWTRRYADEVAVAASRATATAARRRAEWHESVDAVDAAWQAYDAADVAARRAAAAAAFPARKATRTPAELVDRERYLHRAATAACRRHELSIRQLNDVLAHRGGWDPCRHPVEQEAALRRAVRDRLFMAYREATTRERQAWQTAGVASAAMRSLNAEALAAVLQTGTKSPTAEQQWWAEQWTTEWTNEPVRQPAVAGVRLATR